MSNSSKLGKVKKENRRLLQDARDNNAVMTILWHPRFFNEHEFEGYREIYVDLVNTAKEMSAWIGPCSEYLTQTMEDT